jgi:hypothetical protein
MSFDRMDVSCAGGAGATAVGGAAGTATTGMGAAATVSAGAATGAAAGAATDARATGGAALAGRATLAVRRVAVDLVDLVVVIVGLGASGSLTLVAEGSLGVAVAAGALSGTAVAGASVTGGVASGAVWARSWVEDRARTAAIAAIAGRFLGVLWVITRGQRRSDHYGPEHSTYRTFAGADKEPAESILPAPNGSKKRFSIRISPA